MESIKVTVKNTINEKRRAVIFGMQDSAFNNNSKYSEFIDFTTDEGVHITMNGLEFPERRKFMEEEINNVAPEIEYVIFKSNKQDRYTRIGMYTQDANGTELFQSTHLLAISGKNTSSDATELITEDIENGKVLRLYKFPSRLNIMTSMLFNLKPKEEIEMEFIIKPKK